MSHIAWSAPPARLRTTEAVRSPLSSAQTGAQPNSVPLVVATLIACFLVPVSLIPASRGYFFNIPPLPTVWWTTNLIVVFGGLAVVARPLIRPSRAISKFTFRWLLYPMILLAGWQCISTLWNGQDWLLTSYSIFQSVAMVSSVAAGVLLVSGMSVENRLRLGCYVVYLLAIIFLVYLALSFVVPSWRPSADAIDRADVTLGFIRLFGPLGKATSLLFVLLPALGFCLGMAFVPGRSRTFWMGFSFYFFAVTLATGSRGALVCIAAFVVCLVISVRVRAAWFLIPPAIVLPLILLFTGVPERLRYFEDRARLATYESALRAFTDNAQHVVVGTGHGALYTVLHDDTMRKMHQKQRWYLFTDRNQYGFTLRSSHTAILRTLAETGSVGFVLLGVPLFWVTKRLFVGAARAASTSPYNLFASCVLAGCVAGIPYMGLDEFFVSSFWIVFLWFFFVVIGAETRGECNVVPPYSAYR